MSLFKSFVAAENEVWLKSSVQSNFYLYFEIEANKVEQSADRIPLNISLVVDRSGSMSGDKLNYVKKAVDFVIDNLSKEDYLSVVQYDDRIDVVAASAKVTDKKALHQKVKQIEARGMTNLSGGMLEGYAQVWSTKQDKYVNRTLLLSDGLANKGITEPDKLKQMVQKKFRNQQLGLSTFGVGSDFNELLMTHLSEYGGGNYYFIDTPEKIPQIFADELAGLLSVVAQNTKLKFGFPSEYFKCSHVYGYPYEVKGDTILINFNDVISEEKKAVLIKLDILKPIDQPLTFKADLSYDDVVDTMDNITEGHRISLKIAESEEEFNAGIDKKVVEQVVYFVANQLYEDAINKGDKRDFDAAKQLIQQAKSYIEAHFKSHTQTEELKKLYQHILHYEKRLESMAEMSNMDFMMAQKSSRSAQYMSKRKKS